MGTTCLQGSQGSQGRSCGSGKVFQVAFSQAWVPGQPLSRKQGWGSPGETYSDFRMPKLGQLNPSLRGGLINQHRKHSGRKLKIASREDPGMWVSCTDLLAGLHSDLHSWRRS